MLCVFVRTPLPRQLLAVPLSAVSRRVAVGVHGFRATASASVAARTVTSTSRRVASYDRALCTTFGIVSGGVAVTSALKAFDTEASNGGERIVSLEKIQNWYRAYEPDDFTRDWNRTMGRQMEDDSSRALAALIGTNIGVFLLWRVSPRFPGLNQFMWRHFACSYQAVAYGKRVHTLFTSAFSHITVPHLAINMFMLWEFGRHILAPSNRVRTGDPWYDRAIANSRIAGYFGSNFGGGPQLLPLGKFLTLYAGSALSSSALSVIVSRMRGTPGGETLIIVLSLLRG